MWVGGLPMYAGSVPQPRLIEFGATCTLALLHGSLLAVGNAGDSAAILGRCIALLFVLHVMVALSPSNTVRLDRYFSYWESQQAMATPVRYHEHGVRLKKPC